MEICGQMSREVQGRWGGRAKGERLVGAVWVEVMVGTRCPGRTLLRTVLGSRSLRVPGFWVEG